MYLYCSGLHLSCLCCNITAARPRVTVTMITYNRTDLLRIGCLIVPGLELSLDNSAELSKRTNKRRTRRGCRAGRLMKRHIDVVITTRIPQTSTVKRNICTRNVIQLGCERYPSYSTNCFIEPALINHTRGVQLDVQCLNVRSSIIRRFLSRTW